MQGPTIVIVRSTKGDTFGGYAAAHWTSQSGPYSQGAYTHAVGCFLFIVENPHGDAPVMFECKENGRAMYCSPSWGPVFGAGNDLQLMGQTGSGGVTSGTNFPTSYVDTLGRGLNTFTQTDSSGRFSVEDFEVWAVSPS